MVITEPEASQIEVGIPETFSPILVFYLGNWLPALHHTGGKCIVFLLDGSFQVYDLSTDHGLMYKDLSKLTIKRKEND